MTPTQSPSPQARLDVPTSLTAMLAEIMSEYPSPPPHSQDLKLVLHDSAVYVKRTAHDMQLVIDRVGTDITLLDIGGGFGLFALGFARLGARSICSTISTGSSEQT